ncbi:hypothetical protein EDC04DRAFT_2559545 [Pisolithus marmoratus]|nr:hypothetical protein EDC04DRAFT_2559545 [Pisolithus marmoratus]
MSFGGDPLAFYGKRIIEDYHASLTASLPQLDTKKTDFFDISDDTLRFFPHRKVGILGAGVGGLYTALILDSLDIEYEILEGSDHVGGRLSTHKFPGGKKYDYYDAGAMRYPLPKKDEQGRYKNGVMKRLAELIIYEPLNRGNDPLKDKLIPYYFKARDPSKQGFYYFNGIRERISDTPGSFRAEELGVSAAYVKTGSEALHTDVVSPFSRMLIADIENGTKDGWRVMMANESYSLRAYMAFKYIPSANLNLPPQHLHHRVINWCELMQSSTKWYDRALTEEVLESMAFAKISGSDFGDVDWLCFDGGSQALTTKMAEVITTEIENDPISRTRKIVIRNAGVAITVHNEPKQRVYSHVISTIPLPVLRTLDLKDAGLNVKQKNALRQFEYGPSVKIAIRFKEPWWTTKLGIVGGQSFTDLPIRTIVYPSYGVDSDSPSTVLIASYSWTTDAERLGSLTMPDKVEMLKGLVLRNLADAHGDPITLDFLRDQFVDMDVKDWSHDAYTMGAFAFFGPSDFQEMYASLTYPAANKRLHFAGEAISTRHAWVVGALDSAWRAVHEYLAVTRQHDKMKRFKELWGENVEWASPPGQFADDQSNLLHEHLGLIHQAILAGEIQHNG